MALFLVCLNCEFCKFFCVHTKVFFLWDICRILDYNEIEEISKGWLYGLSSLRELSLSNNNINQIVTDAWEFCQKLEDL